MSMAGRYWNAFAKWLVGVLTLELPAKTPKTIHVVLVVNYSEGEPNAGLDATSLHRIRSLRIKLAWKTFPALFTGEGRLFADAQEALAGVSTRHDDGTAKELDPRFVTLPHHKYVAPVFGGSLNELKRDGGPEYKDVLLHPDGRQLPVYSGLIFPGEGAVVRTALNALPDGALLITNPLTLTKAGLRDMTTCTYYELHFDEKGQMTLTLMKEGVVKED